MRLAQIVDEKDKRAARRHGARRKPARQGRPLDLRAVPRRDRRRRLPAQGGRRPRNRQAGGSRRGAERAPGAEPDRPRGPRPCPRHRHRPHPSRLGRGPRQDAQEPRRRRDAHRLHADVQDGPRRRQAEGRGAGVQPEWFYKGDGSTIAAPGADLVSPAFALDGGEEPEIVGVYVVEPRGRAVPGRLLPSATNSPTT